MCNLLQAFCLEVLEVKLGTSDQVILKWFTEFYKVCTVSGYTNQHIFVIFRFLLSCLHGSNTHDIELNVHSTLVNVLFNEVCKIISSLNSAYSVLWES